MKVVSIIVCFLLMPTILVAMTAENAELLQRYEEQKLDLSEQQTIAWERTVTIAKLSFVSGINSLACLGFNYYESHCVDPEVVSSPSFQKAVRAGAGIFAGCTVFTMYRAIDEYNKYCHYSLALKKLKDEYLRNKQTKKKQ